MKTLILSITAAFMFSSITHAGHKLIAAYIENRETVTPEQQDRFAEITDIKAKLDHLPWQLPSNSYRLFKIGTLVFSFHQIATSGSVVAGKATISLANAGIAGIDSGTALADSGKVLVEVVADSWELLKTMGQIMELVSSSPGSKIEIMTADYTAFVSLFENLELLKLIERSENVSALLKSELMINSVASLVAVSRQVAGLKMITGGEMLAYSLQAEIAATLLELEVGHRQLILETWRVNYEKAVAAQTSMLGKKRNILNEEVSTFLQDIELLLASEKMNRGLRTSTYSAKVGILLAGLLQAKFRSVDDALDSLEQSQETLRNYGINSKVADVALAPFAISAALIRKGAEGGLRWSIGPAAYLEEVTTEGVAKVIEAVSTNIKLPNIPRFKLPSLPKISFGSSSNSCVDLLKKMPNEIR